MGGGNPYRYTGKELETDLDLGLYDYGARWYDPAAGRWWGVDAMAEEYFSISPFAYVANNPVKFIDPNGEEIWITTRTGGERLQYKNSQLLTENGEAYNGNDEYALNIAKGLNYLVDNMETAKGYINDLANDTEFKVSIEFTTGLEQYKADGTEKGVPRKECL
ncbi:MAG: RHS repeat-associated core domain-containing protein [Bacteroidia bacterium]